MTGRLLGLLGSGEFEPWAAAVDRRLLEGARLGDGRVLVAPTASAAEGDEVFDRWSAAGLAHYERLGVASEVLELKTRPDAERSDLIEKLRDVSLVFFSGGNPAYLARTLRGTAFWRALLEQLDRGMAYGGCSAGVAALPELAFDSDADPFGPDLFVPGLGLFAATLLVPHWDALDGYVPGLTAHIERTVSDDTRLVGIDERTAIVGDGHVWQVFGDGAVRVRPASEPWREHPAGARVELSLGP